MQPSGYYNAQLEALLPASNQIWKSKRYNMMALRDSDYSNSDEASIVYDSSPVPVFSFHSKHKTPYLCRRVKMAPASGSFGQWISQVVSLHV